MLVRPLRETHTQFTRAFSLSTLYAPHELCACAHFIRVLWPTFWYAQTYAYTSTLYYTIATTTLYAHIQHSIEFMAASVVMYKFFRIKFLTYFFITRRFGLYLHNIHTLSLWFSFCMNRINSILDCGHCIQFNSCQD